MNYIPIQKKPLWFGNKDLASDGGNGGGLPRWLSRKESACNAGATGDVGSILGREDPLEEGMATHSSILAWRIPWTEEPGGLQSMGSQRVGHDLSDLACTHGNGSGKEISKKE